MSDSEMDLNDRLVIAFVQGAKYWEYRITQGTMWQRDQSICENEAKSRLRSGTLGNDMYAKYSKD